MTHLPLKSLNLTGLPSWLTVSKAGAGSPTLGGRGDGASPALPIKAKDASISQQSMTVHLHRVIQKFAHNFSAVVPKTVTKMRKQWQSVLHAVGGTRDAGRGTEHGRTRLP
ncbi:MAG: hypothetical protein XFASWVDF_001130 [Candidatus Fervidibacter sp.]